MRTRYKILHLKDIKKYKKGWYKNTGKYMYTDIEKSSKKDGEAV